MPAKRKSKPAKKKSGAKPTNPALYARVKAEAKRKFKVYPSAYANGWLVTVSYTHLTLPTILLV